MGREQIIALKEAARLKREYPEEAKRQAINKVSEKGKLKQAEKSKLFSEDKLFYAEHWAACPHVCEACKVKLPAEPLTLFFHHALPKRLYAQFRHVHENIIVLCPDCHTQVESDINKVPYVLKRTEEIKRELLG
jgi:5-methylcytosine-specific restriction endonuclease McrA